MSALRGLQTCFWAKRFVLHVDMDVGNARVVTPGHTIENQGSADGCMMTQPDTRCISQKTKNE